MANRLHSFVISVEPSSVLNKCWLMSVETLRSVQLYWISNRIWTRHKLLFRGSSFIHKASVSWTSPSCLLHPLTPHASWTCSWSGWIVVTSCSFLPSMSFLRLLPLSSVLRVAHWLTCLLPRYLCLFTTQGWARGISLYQGPPKRGDSRFFNSWTGEHQPFGVDDVTASE